jgi:hypothetical protein
MQMLESEKNLLERLADALPGLKGYREKESRRDTDKRLREYLADRIEKSKEPIEELKRDYVSQGKLDDLDDLDRLSQKLFKIANDLRHATYGYSGYFDQVKIDEAKLDRLYQYDLSLLGYLEELESSLKLDPTKTFQEGLKDWEKRMKVLEEKVAWRKNLFSVAE